MTEQPAGSLGAAVCRLFGCGARVVLDGAAVQRLPRRITHRPGSSRQGSMLGPKWQEPVQHASSRPEDHCSVWEVHGGQVQLGGEPHS